LGLPFTPPGGVPITGGPFCQIKSGEGKEASNPNSIHRSVS
jgi:hypothetical protein